MEFFSHLLTNLNQAADTNAADTAVSFNIEFDDVDELLMLSRQTGQPVVVNLSSNVLSVTLPGGTGNLYKYNNGNPFVTSPVCGEYFLSDLTGPSGDSDCSVNMFDFAVMASEWLTQND